MFFPKSWLTAVLVQLSFSLWGQTYPSGPQVVSFHSSVDDTEQPYGLYLPSGFQEKKAYPLVVMLHGAGSNHRLAMRRVFGKSNQNGETDVEASQYFPNWKDVPFIVVSPYARGTMGYQGVAEKDVLDVLEDVKKRFKIDTNRMYLTGLSMGGGGTLWLGLSKPDLWAAIAPVCPAAPEGASALAGNSYQLPIRICHGEADPVVKADSVRAWVKRLQDAGAKLEYEEYPGVLHDSWVQAYDQGRVFDWFAQHRRNPFPEKVIFSTSTLRHGKSFWLEVLSKEAGVLAKVTAHFQEKNKLSISSNSVNRLRLDLKNHPLFNGKKPVQLTVDGQALISSGTAEIVLEKENNSWSVVVNAAPTSPLRKKAYLEGPISDALSSRHIYVYGTADNPDEATLEQRKLAAQKAADWSFYRGEFLGRIMVFPRVLRDQDLRESDYASSNLILLGDAQTNQVIAKIAPFALAPTRADLGLAYVFPNKEHYILVNAGLSLMEAPEPAGVFLSGLSRYTTPPFLLKSKLFKDLVVFSKERVLVNTYFDEYWELNAAQKQELKALSVEEVVR